jgi:hypothetical protein
MALMDDLKKKTEEGLKTLRETAQDFAFNVEKQATIGKKRYLDITKLQKNIQKLFTEIGEFVYEEMTSSRSIKKNEPYLQERVADILRMKQEIEAIEDEITEIEHTHPPKKAS